VVSVSENSVSRELKARNGRKGTEKTRGESCRGKRKDPPGSLTKGGTLGMFFAAFPSLSILRIFALPFASLLWHEDRRLLYEAVL